MKPKLSDFIHYDPTQDACDYIFWGYFLTFVGGSFTNFPKNTSIFYLFLSTSFYYYHPFYGIFRKCLLPVILPPKIRHGRVLVLIGLVPIERSTLVVVSFI